MNKIKFSILILILIVAVAYMFYYSTDVEVIYDCNIAEISPDVPPKVKEECRKLMQKHD